eukprot:9327673-Pyramimonas_sp.AAC.3
MAAMAFSSNLTRAEQLGSITAPASRLRHLPAEVRKGARRVLHNPRTVQVGGHVLVMIQIQLT